MTSDQRAEVQILLQIIKVYQQWESKGMDESNSGWLNDYSLYSWKSASFLHKKSGKKRKRTTWLTTESRGPLGELTDWTLPNQQVHNIHKQWGTTWLAALLQKLGAHFGELANWILPSPWLWRKMKSLIVFENLYFIIKKNHWLNIKKYPN